MDKLSVREWIFIILLLMLVEYLITTNSYIFSGDQTLLNYISFASTIASILLAVIAIIYSFLQADSSSKANNKLIDRLDEFRTVSRKIVKSSNKSDYQLQRLSTITDVLVTLQNSMEDSNFKLGSVESKMKEIHENSRNLKEELAKLNESKSTTDTINSQQPNNKKDIARRIIRRSTIHVDIIAYALYKFSEKQQKIPLFEFITTYIFPASETEGKSSLSRDGLLSITFIVIHILKAIELLEIDDNNDDSITLSDDLISELKSYSLVLKERTTDTIKSAVEKIDRI